jgi:hypothetical protein
MRVIAVFFGPCAPEVLTAHGSVFSHDFKRLDRFTKLATSSNLKVAVCPLARVQKKTVDMVRANASMAS